MSPIDTFANRSPLRAVHPGEKAGIAILLLLYIVSSQAVLAWAVIFGLMAVLVLGLMKVPPRFYAALLAAPLAFLLPTCAVLAACVSYEIPAGLSGAYLHIGGRWAGINESSLLDAGTVFVRSMAGISVLCALALSTPASQLLYLFRRIGVPEVVCDVMMLTYKSIFDFGQAALQIFNAQRSRSGYGGFVKTVRSLSGLSANLLQNAIRASDISYQALLARGFDGSFRFIEEDYPFSAVNVGFIIALTGLLLVSAVFRGA